MNRKYNLKLDLQFRCNNSIMKFNQFDNNTSDFFMKISSGGKSFDVEKAIVVLATIKPSGKVASQFVEIENGLVYADLKPNMVDEIGIYTAQAMLILEDERVVTDVISYEVEEDKIFSLLNDTVGTSEEFTLLTDMLSRLSAIEISEEQRVINEAERILSEENRKIEEAKRVEAELIRQHEEADRSKYDATRESNENIRKQNESIRLANETNRVNEEAKRVEEEANRVEAEQLRKDNYNFMTEDEDRRRSEANSHKEAEKLRAQAETNRVNEEAKRRTTEQARVSAENTRVSNENTRKTNEVTRQTNETKRVEAETQRQNRYNSFIADAEANANNFENYTNSAKIKEEERKSNELDRKSQEDRRVSNEVERISNENTRKANEAVREKNEASRQYVFENKVNEVDKKIVELNTTKDNFVSNINTKVDTKISELNTTKDNFVSSISTKVDTKISELNTTKDNFVSSISTKVDSKISELDSAKSDMTNTVANKVNEVENRFNALTSKQQQDAEVIDARDGETSLKARLDRDIEKAKEIYAPVEGSHISTDSSVGYLKGVEILGNTIQSASNLADIRSVGDKVEGQELYEIPVLSRGKNLVGTKNIINGYIDGSTNALTSNNTTRSIIVKVKPNATYTISFNKAITRTSIAMFNKMPSFSDVANVLLTPSGLGDNKYRVVNNTNFTYMVFYYINVADDDYVIQLEEGTQATQYEPYIEDKLTILSPTPLEKVGDVADRLICKDGVWGVEDNSVDILFNETNCTITMSNASDIHPNYAVFDFSVVDNKNYVKTSLLFCNKFNHLLYSADRNSSDKEGCWIGNAVFFTVKILKSKLESVDVNGMKKWLKTNNINLKYLTTQPQFIPLPHDQQIKLRTFANKTNISFGCEIEGTIKAQVPKSLGATVNTHTEQINNLNKELDRVKKLEESTVSTVTTESDFTTVEQTSNGYFEDVKLEGKTLVNLGKSITPITITPNASVGTVVWVPLKIFTQTNKIYTLIYTATNVTETIPLKFKQQDKDRNEIWNNNTIVSNKGNGTHIVTFTSVTDYSAIGFYFDPTSDDTTSTATISNIILLEGDHTQNPPSGYIEGLKSVGQDVNEVSVESVNENLFTTSKIVVQDNLPFSCEPMLDGIKVSSDNALGFGVNLKLKAGNIYYFSGKSSNIVNVRLYRKGGFSWSDVIFEIAKEEVNCASFSKPYVCTQDAEVYFRFWKNAGASTITDVTVSKKPHTGTIQGKHDKKRLLYYNEETQAWEKPILREWDSIEKHANGKYYYHQRSAGVVLNGSENWNNDTNSSTISPATYRQSIQFNAIDIPSASFNTKTSPNIISDLLPTVIFGDVYSYNHIGISISGTDSIGTHIIINNNFTDVTELKQWLQANNVTVVYQLAEEKVYECTNIDLITYNGETNFIVESGVLSPKTTLKVHNNISNVVSLLQKKVSLLESDITSYMITQNRLMLASRYNADTVSFKVDVATLRNSFEYDNDLYELILNNILVGKDNYNREYIENLIIFYWMDFVISDEMHSTLFEIIEEQHNPKVIEEETPLI